MRKSLEVDKEKLLNRLDDVLGNRILMDEGTMTSLTYDDTLQTERELRQASDSTRRYKRIALKVGGTGFVCGIRPMRRLVPIADCFCSEHFDECDSTLLAVRTTIYPPPRPHKTEAYVPYLFHHAGGVLYAGAQLNLFQPTLLERGQDRRAGKEAPAGD